jgi:hypothetical protein
MSQNHTDQKPSYRLPSSAPAWCIGKVRGMHFGSFAFPLQNWELAVSHFAASCPFLCPHRVTTRALPPNSISAGSPCLPLAWVGGAARLGDARGHRSVRSVLHLLTRPAGRARAWPRAIGPGWCLAPCLALGGSWCPQTKRGAGARPLPERRLTRLSPPPARSPPCDVPGIAAPAPCRASDRRRYPPPWRGSGT